MPSSAPNDLARLGSLAEGEVFPAVLSEPRAAHAPPAPSKAQYPTAGDLRIADEALTRGKAATTASNEIRAANAAPAQTEARSAAPDKPGAGSPGAATATAPSRSLRRLTIPLAAIAVVVTLVLVTSARWDAWVGAAGVQMTDNATVHAEMTTLSARVSGNVRRVAVQDFQRVRAGELLMEIEPADYDAVVAQAEANVAAAQAELDILENQKAHQRAVIVQAEAQHQSALARELEARQERKRQEALLRGGLAGTQQRVEQATAAHDTASSVLAASEATIETQRRQLEVLNRQRGLLSAKLRAAQADLAAAQLRLSYTRIVAPFDGVVGERQVQESDYVNVGTNLIAVVPLPNVYVVANYKETQLTHVTSGQPVEVTVDMFPGLVLRGRVARLSPASGATFALLPPDNATGNFTKVVQRIPVRIEFDPGQPLVEQLRPGMSVITRIVTGGAA
jgi:membrane fusion protein, multidrug efflux system